MEEWQAVDSQSPQIVNLRMTLPLCTACCVIIATTDTPVLASNEAIAVIQRRVGGPDC